MTCNVVNLSKIVQISAPDIISDLLIFFVGTRAGRLINFKFKFDFSVKTIGEKENHKIDFPFEHCSAVRRSATVPVCFLEFICYFCLEVQTKYLKESTIQTHFLL